jgi:hypothetical protein
MKMYICNDEYESKFHSPFCIVFFTAFMGTGKSNEYQEEKPILLRNEGSFGFLAHSNGLGIEGKRAWVKTYNRKRFLEAQLVGMKHPKEIKTINTRFDNPKSFIYGKMNTLTILRMAAGQQHILYGKADRSGVEVRLNYAGGLSVGFAKPVYLIIDRSNNPEDPTNQVEEKYDPGDEWQNTVDHIVGRAPFTRGMDELKPYPGVFAKTALNFEYAPNHEDIRSLEIGVAFDAYGKKVPIMAFTKNKQFYLSFFITLIYGQKW